MSEIQHERDPVFVRKWNATSKLIRSADHDEWHIPFFLLRPLSLQNRWTSILLGSGTKFPRNATRCIQLAVIIIIIIIHEWEEERKDTRQCLRWAVTEGLVRDFYCLHPIIFYRQGNKRRVVLCFRPSLKPQNCKWLEGLESFFIQF
jgi:hypothetical protein